MVARVINKLTFQGIKKLKDDGRYGDGGGLYLIVEGNAKRWVFLYRQFGKRREMGLGNLATVSLQAARDKAIEARADLGKGLDPIKERDAKTFGDMEFGQFAELQIVELAKSWDSDRTPKRWISSLKRHAKNIWNRPVASVDTSDVLNAVRPLWGVKHVTAKEIRERIEVMLDAATVMGLRSGENPARWKGHLELILPKIANGTKHHPAIPYEDAPKTMQFFRSRPAFSFRVLELIFLNATRSNEMMKMKVQELDLDGKLWTIPPSRMKGRKGMRREQIIPLSDQSVDLLRKLIKPKAKPGDYVFPGRVKGKCVSETSLMLVMARNCPGYTVHGLRSTFRDWAGDCTNHPNDLIELCLAHKIKNQTERAYRRRDSLDKRRVIMQDWADYLLPQEARPPLETVRREPPHLIA